VFDIMIVFIIEFLKNIFNYDLKNKMFNKYLFK
jgi:hypothetical protein